MSSKSITPAQLVARYVSALLAQAHEAGVVDKVGEELAVLSDLANDSAEFKALLSSAVISRSDREDALKLVCDRLEISDLTRRFLGVLNENGRLSLLGEINTKYTRRRAVEDGYMFVSVSCAEPLSEKASKRLIDVLADIYKKKICLEVTLDESLIAGLCVRVGSELVDGSLKTKLQKLNQVMKGVG